MVSKSTKGHSPLLNALEADAFWEAGGKFMRKKSKSLLPFLSVDARRRRVREGSTLENTSLREIPTVGGWRFLQGVYC